MMAGFQLLAIISMCHKQILLKTFSFKTHTHTQKFALLFLIFWKRSEELTKLYGTFQLMSLFEAILTILGDARVLLLGLQLTAQNV